MKTSTSIAIFNSLFQIGELYKNISREYPLEWEYLHASSTAQIGRLLARNRNIEPEIAAIACYLHDIGRIITGKQEGHALAGEEHAREILLRHKISNAIAEQIIAAIVHHSAKEEIGEPLEELVKDADVIDCALYGIIFQKEGFLKRLNHCQQELGISIVSQTN